MFINQNELYEANEEWILFQASKKFSSIKSLFRLLYSLKIIFLKLKDKIQKIFIIQLLMKNSYCQVFNFIGHSILFFYRNIYFFHTYWMYSYQKYIRDERLNEKCEDIRKSYLKDQDLRQRKNKALIQAYKKRLDGFLLSVIQKPIQVDHHKDLKQTFREQNTKKQVCKDPFRMNFHTTSERLKDVMAQTDYLDGVPFSNVSSHKYRQLASSFTTKPIKYTPSCSVIRIYDSLQKNRTNEVAYYQNSKMNKLIHNENLSLLEGDHKKILQKGIMPSLNRKSHFNSLKTMYVDCPSGFSAKKKTQKENMSEKYDEELDRQKRQVKNKRNDSEHVNQKQNAKDAMIKCRLLKKKDPSFLMPIS